MLKHDSIVCVW